MLKCGNIPYYTITLIYQLRCIQITNVFIATTVCFQNIVKLDEMSNVKKLLKKMTRIKLQTIVTQNKMWYEHKLNVNVISQVYCGILYTIKCKNK